jgi:hypothetical protein
MTASTIHRVRITPPQQRARAGNVTTAGWSRHRAGGNALRSGDEFAPIGRPGRRCGLTRFALAGDKPSSAPRSLAARAVSSMIFTNGCTPAAPCTCTSGRLSRTHSARARTSRSTAYTYRRSAMRNRAASSPNSSFARLYAALAAGVRPVGGFTLTPPPLTSFLQRKSGYGVWRGLGSRSSPHPGVCVRPAGWSEGRRRPCRSAWRGGGAQRPGGVGGCHTWARMWAPVQATVQGAPGADEIWWSLR